MRVALLVGVLMFDLLAGLYEIEWMDGGMASPEAGGSLKAMDNWPPPPAPPSFP